jgi:hypothetical protein
MNNEEQARMLLKTALSLIRKLGVRVSFIPSGRKRGVKLPVVVDRFVFKKSPVGGPTKYSQNVPVL